MSDSVRHFDVWFIKKEGLNGSIHTQTIQLKIKSEWVHDLITPSFPCLLSAFSWRPTHPSTVLDHIHEIDCLARCHRRRRRRYSLRRLPSALFQILQQSDGYIDIGEAETRNCEIKLRVNPVRRREEVFVGCGAGFGGDRPLAALKLLQKVNNLDYLVLECLAERTLADRYQAVMSGGEGFDPRISEWMQLLLPLAVEKGVCIITNMGATNALAAQEKVLEIASRLGVKITVGVAHQFDIAKAGLVHSMDLLL